MLWLHALKHGLIPFLLLKSVTSDGLSSGFSNDFLMVLEFLLSLLDLNIWRCLERRSRARPESLVDILSQLVVDNPFLSQTLLFQLLLHQFDAVVGLS